ncbi:hypothetical protein IH992_21640 [Candidatus Poribacteria bacterium]|nr:hypothetical protein [Candidatus Poribacteria bacterium]
MIKQQLAAAASTDETCELDPQLQPLLLKHFTLHVGVDVGKASFVVKVKNAANQNLLTNLTMLSYPSSLDFTRVLTQQNLYEFQHYLL